MKVASHGARYRGPPISQELVPTHYGKGLGSPRRIRSGASDTPQVRPPHMSLHRRTVGSASSVITQTHL